MPNCMDSCPNHWTTLERNAVSNLLAKLLLSKWLWEQMLITEAATVFRNASKALTLCLCYGGKNS